MRPTSRWSGTHGHRVVAPNQEIWIGLLVAFEAIAGGLVWSGGRRATVGLIAIMVFHVLLLPFGWFLYVWSAPMLIGLTLLLRAHLRESATAGAADVHGGDVPVGDEVAVAARAQGTPGSG